VAGAGGFGLGFDLDDAALQAAQKNSALVFDDLHLVGRQHAPALRWRERGQQPPFVEGEHDLVALRSKDPSPSSVWQQDRHIPVGTNVADPAAPAPFRAAGQAGQLPGGSGHEFRGWSALGFRPSRRRLLSAVFCDKYVGRNFLRLHSDLVWP
jgi:hypothetical protein